MDQQQLQAALGEAKACIINAQFRNARLILERLLAAVPNHPEAHVLHSQASLELGFADEAIDHIRQAVQLVPQNIKLRVHLAEVLEKIHRERDAIATFEEAINIAPQNAQLRIERARLLQVVGDLSRADSAIRTLIKKFPNEGVLYRLLSTITKFKRFDAALPAMLKLWGNKALQNESRMSLGFALAKAMEDIGEYGRVFKYLDAANQIQQRLKPHSKVAFKADVESLLSAQGAEFVGRGKSHELRPVFVCGMPRSGTTLVEQIISSHSQAKAGGEMGHATRLAYRHFGLPADFMPLSKITDKMLAAFADDYLAMLSRDTAAKTGVVTDKSIQSYLLAGLLHAALPNAKFIIVQRDARDIALSIYRNFFALGSHTYSNNLVDIADQIKLFRRVVEHWKTLLPDQIYEVRYEDLVSEPEKYTREMLEYCELPWEPECLDFYKSKNVVKTLSVAQARNPISDSRKQAWRRYEAEMNPFLEAWGAEGY